MEIEKIITEKIGDISAIPTEVKEKIVKFVETVETEKTSLSDNLSKLTADLEFQKNESKKAFETRDAVKNEARLLRERLDKSGGNTYIELYDASQKTIEQLKLEKENLLKEKDSAIGQLDKIKEDSRNSLIETLPKDSKERQLAETFDFKTDSGMNQLKTLVELFKGNKFIPDDGRSGEFTIDPKKGWFDYSSKELDTIKEKNPDHFNKLKSEMYKK